MELELMMLLRLLLLLLLLTLSAFSESLVIALGKFLSKDKENNVALQWNLHILRAERKAKAGQTKPQATTEQRAERNQTGLN